MSTSRLTLVPPTKIPPRAPFGPSLVFTAGMFLEGMALLLQKSAAVRREIWISVSSLHPHGGRRVDQGMSGPSLPGSTWQVSPLPPSAYL